MFEIWLLLKVLLEKAQSNDNINNVESGRRVWMVRMYHGPLLRVESVRWPEKTFVSLPSFCV